MSINTSADYEKCVLFHGHSCPGLAIGFAAARIAVEKLGLTRSADEETVAVIENDSCAVDALQVMLGTTFGKGNLVFRDWGKQVFTVYERKSGKALRLSFTGPMPHHEERMQLRALMQTGAAGPEQSARWDEIGKASVQALLESPDRFFTVAEIEIPEPAKARIVDTQKCALCGEPVMTTRIELKDGAAVCKGCC